MDNAQLAELRDQHKASARWHTKLGEPLCEACDELWPCEVRQLADALDAAMKRVKELEGPYGHARFYRH